MRVQPFPKCCGIGVLIIEHLTGKGKEADLAEIGTWVAYAKRNGFRMYDYNREYGGEGNPMNVKSIIGGPGDQKEYYPKYSWGMLLAVTPPRMSEAAERLKDFGFKELFEADNPFYGGNHPMKLWVLDLTKITIETAKKMEQPKIAAKPEEVPAVAK